MMRAVVFASLLLILTGLATSTPTEARPDLCSEYGACVYACVGDGPSCGGVVCASVSQQVPFCVPPPH